MASDLISLREKLNPLLSEYAHARERVREERAVLKEAKLSHKESKQAQTYAQEVASQVQEQAHRQIASVVSRCLESVFGEDAYTFKIRFAKKRGRTEAELLLERDGVILEDPKSEAGGGVIDVAAFALRMACLMLSTPKKRKFLCLDEPFKFINGSENQKRVGGMLLSLAKDLGVQILLVSDDDWLKVGKVIELEK